MSQSTATTVRAFSTSHASAAKKLYQLKPLQEAKKILKAAEAAKEAEGTASNPNKVQDFLEQVKIPQESDRVLRRIKAKIHDLQGRISEVVGQVAKAPTAQPPKHVSDALDAASHGSNALAGRAKWRKRKAAQAREEKAFAVNRTEQLNELEKLLTEYKRQVDAVKGQAQKLAQLKKRKEQVLGKKRALLEELSGHEEAERKAKVVVRVTEKEKEKENESYDLDDILDDALGRVKRAKKEPRHPPKITRERDVSASTIVMRQAGLGAVSVLGRNMSDRSSGEDALADPIMDKKPVGMAPGERKETLGIAGKQVDGTMVNKTVADETVVDASTFTIHSNAGNAFPLESSQGQNPSGVSKTIKRDALGSSSPSPPPLPLPNKKLGLVVPPSGFIPIDEDLIVSFEAPVPQLQQQVLALRDRLKSSYPRIDTLPYDVWTSENKRTLQTWLKILVGRWRARFNDVDFTGQLDKAAMDERLKAVLDQMVRDHDLSNDAAERMAMRWHEVFDKRNALDGDAEGKLDWEEMEAGGMGFLANDTGYEPLQQQQPDTEAVSQAQHDKPQATRGEPSDSTMPGLMGRRMYSTSSRRTFLSSSESESKARSINRTDAKDKPHQPQPQASQSPPSSVPQRATPQPHLPHLTPSGSAHMVSVSDKQHTTRTAIAVGTVYFTNPTPLQLIRSNSLKKGDVLGTSRIAGIMAAKKCPEIIPLCHPIALTHVGVELRAFDCSSSSSDPSMESLPSTTPSPYSVDPGYGGIQIEAKVQCTGPTGVEMEALTAVMGAALSVVDMCKAVDKFQRVQDVRVVLKEGGKSGVWREEGWGSWQD